VNVQKTQYTTEDHSPFLDKHATTRVQAISSNVLYFSRDVDPKTLPVPNEISNQQSKPTGKTARTCEQLMDCLFTHPKAVIQYYASDMTLSLVSDVAYLVLPDARNEQNGIILQLRNHRSGHHGSECTCK